MFGRKTIFLISIVIFLMAAVMSLAMIAGPLIGGFITDHLSWRWAFYVNLPLGGAALVVIATTLHLPRRRSRAPHRLARGGLLTVAITSLVLITTWGGSQYAWASSEIVGLAVLAAAALVAVRRRRAPRRPNRSCRCSCSPSATSA